MSNDKVVPLFQEPDPLSAMHKRAQWKVNQALERAVFCGHPYTMRTPLGDHKCQDCGVVISDYHRTLISRAEFERECG